MARPDTASTEFQSVVELNESTKRLLAHSFRVNLLALDAMVQSKRGGGSVRGFDEVSSQMLTWSRDLHAQLQRLGQLSTAIVSRTSLATKEAHTLRLFEAATLLSSNLRAQGARDRLAELHAQSVLEVNRQWRRARELLSDLDQLAMMACVLARSAMIEACSAGPELRGHLSEVSSQFNHHAGSVVEILAGQAKSLRRL